VQKSIALVTYGIVKQADFLKISSIKKVRDIYILTKQKWEYIFE